MEDTQMNNQLPLLKSHVGQEAKSAEAELDLEICLELEEDQKSAFGKKAFRRSTKQATDSSVEFVGPNDPMMGSQPMDMVQQSGSKTLSSQNIMMMANIEKDKSVQ